MAFILLWGGGGNYKVHYCNEIGSVWERAISNWAETQRYNCWSSHWNRTWMRLGQVLMMSFVPKFFFSFWHNGWTFNPARGLACNVLSLLWIIVILSVTLAFFRSLHILSHITYILFHKYMSELNGSTDFWKCFAIQLCYIYIWTLFGFWKRNRKKQLLFKNMSNVWTLSHSR